MGDGIRIFRVRKSFDDIASQKGAFIIFEAAVKRADETGLNVYDGFGQKLYGKTEEK